ncbi:Cytochrome c-type biogenesis protein CcmC [Oligella urethralis]|uniref:Heme exporter protein C n=2 Tax=Oligella urethralis TaxID=90245 RepID=A0A2X1WEF6_9BURK|nr:Cytochrome c-type biogenesis protein CcmC [Oligella urethralis]SUA59965.1 Cytochrome c-type biogenesis protein CcmC [Oligella urethralis]
MNKHMSSFNQSSAQPSTWRRFASPLYFERFAKRGAVVAWSIAIVLGIIGCVYGFLFAPLDAVQGNSYRIMFLHVPSSWMAMIIYVAMAFWSIIYLVWRTHTSILLVRAMAPTGALMCLLSLLSGAIWGKPTWGTYWVWDARLTAMLLLLFLYLGLIALLQSIRSEQRANLVAALWSIVGVVNVPIIYFSVIWWNTLHQGASITMSRGISIHPDMLYALLFMSFAAWAYAIGMILARARWLLLNKYAHSDWAQQIILAKEGH